MYVLKFTNGIQTLKYFGEFSTFECKSNAMQFINYLSCDAIL